MRLALLAAAFSHAAAHGADRVALVVGNADYEHTTPLANPANDARDIAAKLRQLGFDVVEDHDLDRSGMFDRMRAFHAKAHGAEASLFFYAGHGMQVDGRNYLVPVDARIEVELDVRERAVDLDDVMAGMRSGVGLVFLDACRNNPLAEPLTRSTGLTRSAVAARGLAPVRGVAETLIAYATDPGQVAADGRGRNSPFTAALLEHLDTAGLSVHEMLTRVKRTVRERTDQRQRPWTLDSLSSTFHFRPGAAVPAPAAVPADVLDPVAETWKAVRDSGDWRLAREFVAQHGDSAYGGAARALERRLLMRRFKSLCDSRESECFSIRTAECGDCGRTAAAVLRSELDVFVRSPSDGSPNMPGCIGFREDLGGTREFAELVRSVLGADYQVAVGTCNGDGWPITVSTR